MTTLSPFNLEEIRVEKAARMKKSLSYFFKQAWHVMEPGIPLIWNWHMDAIFEHLQAVISGQIHRLVVNLAPGHAKSTIFSVALPAWTWTTLPTSRWLCASHSLDLAERDNNNCRAVIESEWYQAHFGDIVQMKYDQNEKGYFENTQRGYRLCTSVGAKGTGKRGTHLMIDDPNDSKASAADIESTKSWFGRTWLSRLNDMQFGTMIVVGQRIHEQDLTGHIQHLGGWEHLSLPTEYESSRKCFTSIGWSDPRKEDGDLLWPEKFPLTVLNSLKAGLGSIGYAAQYQQSPVPAAGGQFKKQWFRYFSQTPDAYVLKTPNGITSILKSSCWRFSVVDLAISSKQSADYTVIQTYDVTPQNDLLLIDQIRDRLDNAQQQKAIRMVYHVLHPQFFKIESVGYQLALIQQLRNEPKEHTDLLVDVANPEALDKTLQALDGTESFLLRDEITRQPMMYEGHYIARVLGDIGYFKFACEHQGYCTIVGQPGVDATQVSIPVREFRPVRDKVSRASTPSIQMENGKVYFLEGAAYLIDLEPELLTFPKGAHDDQVDGLSMGAEEVVIPHGPLMWSPDDPPVGKTDEVGPVTTALSVMEIEGPRSQNDFYEEGSWYDGEAA